MAIRFLYVTAGSAEEAREIGRALVEARLAACANVIEGMRSFFWWDGAVQEEEETVLILKTSVDRVEAATDRIKALHSYDVPCVVALPVDSGNPDFLSWVGEQTSKNPSS